MTAARLPERLLTVDEFLELPESERRYELQGGNLVMAPPPIPDHQVTIDRLSKQVEPHLPSGLVCAPGVGVDLQLAPPGHPGYVRIPDLSIVTAEGLRRCRREGELLRASELVLAVEVLSPSSLRIDRTLKRAEYADAGVPHYWIVDIRDRHTLTRYALAGEFGYLDAPAETGVVEVDAPFAVRIDLDALRPW